MVEVVGVGLEALIVQEVERIDGLDLGEYLRRAHLFHDGFRGVHDDAFLELLVPVHLHFHDEVAVSGIGTAHVNHAVLPAVFLRHHLRRLVLDAGDGCVLCQRQQGVEKTHRQVLVLAKHQFERQVGLGVQILTFHFRVSFLCLTRLLHNSSNLRVNTWVIRLQRYELNPTSPNFPPCFFYL